MGREGSNAQSNPSAFLKGLSAKTHLQYTKNTKQTQWRKHIEAHHNEQKQYHQRQKQHNQLNKSSMSLLTPW